MIDFVDLRTPVAIDFVIVRGGAPLSHTFSAVYCK